MRLQVIDTRGQETEGWEMEDAGATSPPSKQPAAARVRSAAPRPTLQAEESDDGAGAAAAIAVPPARVAAPPPLAVGTAADAYAALQRRRVPSLPSLLCVSALAFHV